MALPLIEGVDRVVELWSDYGGETRWVKALRRFGELGGKIQYWCGMPQSASAIPLTFALFDAEERKLECSYRLKDIRNAISVLEDAHKKENSVNNEKALTVDRELFHQMMRRLSGNHREFLPTAQHIKVQETARRLADATAAQTSEPVTITLGVSA